MDFAKKIVRRKDANLLRNSTTTSEYPVLAELLAVKPTIDENDVAQLDAQSQVFFRDTYPLVLEQAIREWKPDQHNWKDHSADQTKWVRCSLCGRKNRYECHIVNLYNGRDMNVGSDCVEHFGLLSPQEAEHFKKEARKIHRYDELSKLFPSIRQTVDGWPHDLESQPLIIADRFERPYLQLGDKVRRLVEDFLAEREQEGFEEELRQLLDQRENMLAEINRWVAENRDNPFAASRQIEKWLRSQPHDQVAPAISQIKRDGRISMLSLWRIEEPQFMKTLVPAFDEILRPSGICVEKTATDDVGFSGYVLVPAAHPRVRLFCRHKELAMNYSGPILGIPLEDSVRVEDVVAKCRIHDGFSRAEVIGLLKKVVKSGVTLHDYDVEADQVTVFEQQSGKYLTVSLRQMAERFKSLALGLKGAAVEDVVRWVASLPNTRMTRDELRHVGRASATMHRVWDTGEDSDSNDPRKSKLESQ